MVAAAKEPDVEEMRTEASIGEIRHHMGPKKIASIDIVS